MLQYRALLLREMRWYVLVNALFQYLNTDRDFRRYLLRGLQLFL